MDAEDLSQLKYADLQALAKKHGIKANGGREYMIQELAAFFEQQAAASTSRTTRSASRTGKRPARESPTDDEADAPANPPKLPTVRRTRSGHQSAVTPNSHNNPSTPTVQRTRSRVISAAMPRAALIRTSSQSKSKPILMDSGAEGESTTANATPPPPLLARKKALDSQKRLGVGRPRAIGGSGARKSTARKKSASAMSVGVKKDLVMVVVPTLQAVREEEAASRASVIKQRPPAPIELDDDDEEDERPSTPPPPRFAPRAIKPRPSPRDTALLARLSALEDKLNKTEEKLNKTDVALDSEKRNVAVLSARVTKLEEENTRIRDELEALNRSDSSDEKQIVSETPQTSSSGVSTPAPVVRLSAQPQAKEPEASPSALPPTTQTVLPLPIQPAATASESSKAPRPRSAANSRHESPVPPPTRNLLKAATTSRAALAGPIRAFEFNVTPSVVPQSPAPAEKTLGKHPRDRDGADSSVQPDESGTPGGSASQSPKKRRRVDEGPHRLTQVEDVDMDGEPVVEGEDAPPPAGGGLALPPTRPPRASSQPPRAIKGLRAANPRASAEPVASGSGSTGRRVRAGSADPRLARSQNRVSVATVALDVVAEQQQPVAGPSSLSHHHHHHHQISLAPIDPLPLPRTQDASIPKFISYPLPGDPVKQLQPLTHFDSGTEFFGPHSKRNYKTDWHEGTVFDDPFDAETVRRAAGVAAEEVQGGFGPQGLASIDDGLEERDPAESLGVTGMMTFPGDLDGDIDIHGGL
ncbi:hypothetical protein FRB90_000206 [Tulasnella sp. 427]|nr:hypothetical protein FRB90_000206 [Tulasnella sp. 427]